MVINSVEDVVKFVDEHFYDSEITEEVSDICNDCVLFLFELAKPAIMEHVNDYTDIILQYWGEYTADDFYDKLCCDIRMELEKIAPDTTEWLFNSVSAANETLLIGETGFDYYSIEAIEDRYYDAECERGDMLRDIKRGIY